MKKLIERLTKIDALIEEAKKRQTRTKIATYYTEFAGEEQREKDIKSLQKVEARLLGYKHTILYSMRIKTALEQYAISERLIEININQ